MGRRLREAGIDAKSTRNAALFALAEDPPAAILPDLLVGMHVTTAERWAELARRDWPDYLGARIGMNRSEASSRQIR